MKHGLWDMMCMNMIPKTYIDQYVLCRDVRDVALFMRSRDCGSRNRTVPNL
jgi:hypothetical protein